MEEIFKIVLKGKNTSKDIKEVTINKDSHH